MTRFLTVEEASKAVGIPKRTIYNFCDSRLYGKSALLHTRVGKIIYINPLVLENWLKRFERGGGK